MNINRAKLFTITLLTLLNAVLLACNLIFTDFTPYKLTDEALGNITGVLSLNKITLNAAINRNYKPKSAYKLGACDFSDERLAEIFLQNTGEIAFETSNSRNIYRNARESLTVNINDGYTVYRNREAQAKPPDPAAAAAVCEGVLRKINAVSPGFALDMPNNRPYVAEDGLVYEYRQNYKGRIINSNFLILTVSESGVSRAQFSQKRVLGAYPPSDVCPPDIALLAAMTEIKNIYGSAPVSIEQIDCVFDVPSSGQNAAAEPCYRFFLAQSNEPILVNAYTGEIN